MFSKKEMLPEEEIRQVEERLKVLNTDFVLPQTLSTQELHKRLTPEDCRNFREAGHPDFMYWQRYAGMVASFIVVLVGLVMVSSGMISFDSFAPAPAMPEMAAAEAEVAAMDMDEMGVAEAALYDGAEAEEAAETKMAAAGRSRLYASDYDDIAAALQQATYAAVSAPAAQNAEADADSAEGLAVPDATWQNVFSDVPGESPDILKSDGTYFYYYCAPTTVGQPGKVYIIKAETLEIVSSVSTGIAQGTELFIRDGRLVLISRNHKDAATVLYDAAVLTDRQGQSVEPRQLAETAAQKAEAYGFTTVSVYDLSDITKPVLVRSFMQDGHYQNSRLVGGRMYLFTRKHLDGA
ncbi:MAG: beta-propeller domain-containing protein, partial [Oscillospiraceae bacterium]|nr:beta-propeller domain-containing protein [Oscillospiraceae bacterium]